MATTTTPVTSTTSLPAPHPGTVAVRHQPPTDLASRQPARVLVYRPIATVVDEARRVRPAVRVAAGVTAAIAVPGSLGFALGFALVGVQLLATVAGTAIAVVVLLLAASTVLSGHGGGCCCPFHN